MEQGIQNTDTWRIYAGYASAEAAGTIDEG